MSLSGLENFVTEQERLLCLLNGKGTAKKNHEQPDKDKRTSGTGWNLHNSLSFILCCIPCSVRDITCSNTSSPLGCSMIPLFVSCGVLIVTLHWWALVVSHISLVWLIYCCCLLQTQLWQMLLWTSCVCWWRTSGVGCALRTFRRPSGCSLAPSSRGHWFLQCTFTHLLQVIQLMYVNVGVLQACLPSRQHCVTSLFFFHPDAGCFIVLMTASWATK